MIQYPYVRLASCSSWSRHDTHEPNLRVLYEVWHESNVLDLWRLPQVIHIDQINDTWVSEDYTTYLQNLILPPFRAWVFCTLVFAKTTLLKYFYFISSFSVAYIYNHIHRSLFAEASLHFFIACCSEEKTSLGCQLGPAWQQASALPTELRCTLTTLVGLIFFCRELSPEPSLRPLEWGNFSISPATQGTTVDNKTCHR